MKSKISVLDADTLRRSIVRISHEIMEKNTEHMDDLVLIGVHTRGVPIAGRIAAQIMNFDKKKIPVGTLDITLYRDDLSFLSDHPIINGSDIPFSIEGKRVVIVDDVIYTGRTVRAAIDALFEMGRAKTIQLAVLIDRGHRELPIRADYVGKNVPTSRSEIISVHLQETDGEDSVTLLERG